MACLLNDYRWRWRCWCWELIVWEMTCSWVVWKLMYVQAAGSRERVTGNPSLASVVWTSGLSSACHDDGLMTEWPRLIWLSCSSNSLCVITLQQRVCHAASQLSVRFYCQCQSARTIIRIRDDGCSVWLTAQLVMTAVSLSVNILTVIIELLCCCIIVFRAIIFIWRVGQRFKKYHCV